MLQQGLGLPILTAILDSFLNFHKHPSSCLQVFKALTALAKESPTSEDAFKPVEQMINEAFEEIDKATGGLLAMPVLGVSRANDQ